MRFIKKVLTGVGLSLLLVTSTLSASELDSDPIFKDFQKLQQDMNKVFENFHTKYFNMNVDDKFFEGTSFSPKADLKDSGDHYEIKVDLPGVNESETKVKVEKNILMIEAKSEKSKEQKSDKMIKKERFVGIFSKSLKLPDDANSEKLTTKYKDGVLTITIPKKG